MKLSQESATPQPPDEPTRSSSAPPLLQVIPLLQAILDSAQDAVFLKDAEGRLLNANRAAQQILELPIEAITGTMGEEKIASSGAHAAEATREIELSVVRTGNPVTVEETRTAEGTARIFLTTRSPYKDEHGQVVGIIGNARDITEQKQVEAKLRESQQRWRFALDGSGDGVWDWDMKTGQVYYSRQWKAMLGYAPEEIGDTVSEWSERVHPEDLPRCWEMIQKHFEGATAEFVLEHRMRAKDGTWRWILDRGKVVERAEDGTPQRTIGTHTDVTERKEVEAEVELQRERLALATAVSLLGVWDHDFDTDTIVCDPLLNEIFGVDPEHPIRKLADLQACIHPDDLNWVMQQVSAGLADKGSVFRSEFRVITARGETRWISGTGRSLPSHGRNPNRLVGVAKDVTERRLAAETLQTSYDALLQAERLARIGSWTMDLKTGNIVSSDMLKQMHGLRPGDPPLNPEKLKELLPPEGYEKVRSGIARCIAEGTPYEVETPHKRVDGTTYFTHIRGKANRDASGKIVSLTGTVQDISEREEARARLAAVADNLPNGAIYRMERTADGEAALTYISAGVAAILGIEAAEIVKRQQLFLDAIHPEDMAQYHATLRASLASRAIFDCQFRATTRTGQTIWIHSRSVPRYQADGTTVWDGIMSDFTEERRAAEVLEQAKEAAEAAERAKSEFLATMSHEIRTPMNTVLGMTRLMLQTDLAPRQKNYLEKINMAANTLISIINDVLDYSKIEAGRLELEQTEFTLESVLESVAAVTAMRAEEKGLEIAYSVAPDVPDLLVGDSLRLGQVMINLVSNAVKFTEAGEVVVSVERMPQTRTNTVPLQFQIRDTGIGLDSSQIAGLFRAFSQADRDVSRKYGGTGLGLAICKQLVERMGGVIWVSSEPGKGSSFFFTIEAGLSSVPDTDHAARGQMNLHGRRVLIVDDNASAREILSQMVRNFGMQVEGHASGASALKALRQASLDRKPFELVLMDWRMPEMDGLDAAQRIKADGILRETPAVLMVTAYGREEVLRRSEQLGLQGVLIKPVTDSVMFNTIMDTLEHANKRWHTSNATLRDSGRLGVAQPALSKEKWVKQLHHRRVLVVDDNALNREVVSDFLVLVGMEVETAANGREALARLEQDAFEAVLMDVHMPVMDGLEAAREIRRHGRWATLPIIALTAQARLEDRQASLAAGMNAHITKPIDERELYRTLLDLLPHRAVEGSDAAADDNEPEADASVLAVSPGLIAADAEESRAVQPGILDLSTTLARLGHNRERLTRLVKGFLRDFSGAPAQMERAYHEGRFAQVAEIAHAVRGASSYLDAHQLCLAAERLERTARRADGDGVRDLIRVFDRHLDAVLAELQMLTAPSPTERSAREAGELSIVLDLLTQVEPLLVRGDYAAQSLLEQIAARLRGTGASDQAEAIRLHFDELELESAVNALRRLRSDLDLGEGVLPG